MLNSILLGILIIAIFLWMTYNWWLGIAKKRWAAWAMQNVKLTTNENGTIYWECAALGFYGTTTLLPRGGYRTTVMVASNDHLLRQWIHTDPNEGSSRVGAFLFDVAVCQGKV